MEDPAVRIKLLEKARDAGFKFLEKAFREESKFTRILSRSQALQRKGDDEPDDSFDHVRDITYKLWKRAWEDGEEILKVLHEVEWD